MKSIIISIALAFSLQSLASNTEEIRKKAELFSSQLIAESYTEATATFNTALTSKISAQKLQEIWIQIQTQFGLYEKKDSVKASNSGKTIFTIQPLTFANGVLDLKLGFDETDLISSIFFTPHVNANIELVTNALYYEKEITVIGSKNLPLNGIMTLPMGKSAVPCVILVHGSGANDMDETFGKHKLFRDLAYGFAERGIAVIRYEKRTKTYGGTPLLDAEKLTLYEETIEDAKAAVKLASKEPLVDAKNIFVLGHSLGGMSAPRIAQQSKKTKGIIILAGNARPMQDVILDQFEYLFNADGNISPEEQKMINGYKSQLRILEKLKEDKKAIGVLPLGLSAAYWKYLLDYDQLATAQKLKKAILIVQAGRDYQVPPKEFEIWKEQLEGHDNVSYQYYEKLNHLMLEGEGPSYPNEYEKEGNPPTYLVEGLSEWIFKQK